MGISDLVRFTLIWSDFIIRVTGGARPEAQGPKGREQGKGFLGWAVSAIPQLLALGWLVLPLGISIQPVHRNKFGG